MRFRHTTALTCTCFAFPVVLLLAALPGDAWKREAMSSIAVTVGFSWRRCYGHAIDFITERLAQENFPEDATRWELVFEILLSIPLLALLMTAQGVYIAPKTLAPALGTPVEAVKVLEAMKSQNSSIGGDRDDKREGSKPEDTEELSPDKPLEPNG